MAQFEQVLFAAHDASGATFRFIAICDDTQTEPDEEGWPSPLVVAVRIVNTTTRAGFGSWQRASGVVDTYTIAPGENRETSIAPPRRIPLYRFPVWAAWGGGA